MQQYLIHFGQSLRQLRTKEGLTQAELARRLGVGQGHIATLEGAKENRQPSLEFLIAVSKFFGVGIDKLLGMAQEPLSPTELDALPLDVRNQIEGLIATLARKQEGDRWRHLSTQIVTLGGEEHVTRASRQTGVLVTPENEPELACN